MEMSDKAYRNAPKLTPGTMLLVAIKIVEESDKESREEWVREFTKSVDELPERAQGMLYAFAFTLAYRTARRLWPFWVTVSALASLSKLRKTDDRSSSWITLTPYSQVAAIALVAERVR